MATEDATYPAFEQDFNGVVTRTGLTLAGDPVLFATNAEDYNPVASKINAQNPDAVWLAIGIDPSFFGIIKGLRTLGYEGPIGFPIDAPSAIGALGDAATGLVGILSKQLVDPYIAAPMKRLLEMGDPNRHVFGLAPNALYMLKYAIEAADSLDPTVVRDKVGDADQHPHALRRRIPEREPAVRSDEPRLGLSDPGVPRQRRQIRVQALDSSGRDPVIVASSADMTRRAGWCGAPGAPDQLPYRPALCLRTNARRVDWLKA